MKRLDYILWKDYFMAIAELSAMRSKDPNTQVGCCIVNRKNIIIGMGYNGFPNGCSDDDFPWTKSKNPDNNKYLYVTHAEANGIINSNSDLCNARMFVTLFPCCECAKLIIQSGIKEVFYLENKYHDTDSCFAARRMFLSSGVWFQQMVPQQRVNLV